MWLVIYLNCTMMHGLTKLKFTNGQQAGQTYAYKNFKRKLHKKLLHLVGDLFELNMSYILYIFINTLT